MKKVLSSVLVASFLFSCQKSELVEKYERIAEIDTLKLQLAEKDSIIYNLQNGTDSSARFTENHLTSNSTAAKTSEKSPIKNKVIAVTTKKDEAKKSPPDVPTKNDIKKTLDHQKDIKITKENSVKESSEKQGLSSEKGNSSNTLKNN